MNVETVISEYQSSLRAFLQSRLRNASDVDDVLQDALMKTFRNISSLKSSGKIKPWLFQIANNALMDHYRRVERDNSISAENLWYDDEENSQHAFEGCLDSFLSALPPESGDLLRKIEIEGVSQKDYAEEIGISYSTLKSRVQSSRKQLRGLFERCCSIAFAADGSVMDYSQKPGGCDTC